MVFFPVSTLSLDISIDCGASRSYVDSDNVTWLGDRGFVTTGESFLIPGNLTEPVNNLRYFPSGQTNCYTNIPATKGLKTLVRTLFYYGNYDRKSSPPSFNVVYDGKHLDSVVTTSLFISEVIFAPASENISICLVRTSPSDDPFISSIEVYSLDAGMYDDLGPDEGLILRQRFAYGAKEIIGYPSDPYGRLWFPSRSSDTTISELTTLAPSVDISGASNKPPEIVMSKALSAASLILSDETLPLAGIPVYLALYFSEPQSLGLTQTRSFNISLDTTQVGSGPIIPVFGKVTQVVVRDVVATSVSQVVIQSTDDSTLPPIINALELYSISSGQDGGNYGGGENGSGGGGQTSGSNDDSEGSGGTETRTNKNAVGGGANKVRRKNKLPLILGVTFASVFVALSSAFAAIFLRKRPHAKPQSNTLPTTSTGISPLVGQQLASDANHPGHDEPGVYDIDELIGVNDSYVVHQDDHHQHGPA
ncbi:Malectin-like domain [Arabidopsis thaliana x Arabidopsis arenosa]|uniref:Malectin-like domain n=1 Tax=Arabidopsis thaliana x Arabidopsis arenosa TaxID=1240361 RepID=A0A8T1ZMD1_9BRAS|nr:Malectin-like domain [Arabidopsis thaliana x Arabidopsis arenosa]